MLYINSTNHVARDVAFKKIRLLQTAEDNRVTKVHCMRERGQVVSKGEISIVSMGEIRVQYYIRFTLS